MANEILVTSQMSFSKGSKSDEVGYASERITMNGDDFVRGTMSVSTTQTAIPLGAVGTCGLLWIRNNGTATVNLRMGSSGANVNSWKNGEGYWVRLAASTPYVVTASGTAEIEYAILED